jgi:raffinose/stachyose/melibiose transport system substrate-binding protein
MRKALGNNLGIHKLPDFSTSASIQNSGVGGTGTALIVSNYSKHKEESVKFIKFLMSQSEQTKRAQDASGNLINATDVDVTKIYQEPYKVQIQKWVLEPNTIFWPDNIFPADLTSEISTQAQLAWTGKISSQQFMSKLDAKRDEVLKAPKQ